ncbi:MAG: hypothetical protein ACK4OE_23405 [Acidovorax sp.]|uniref:hypothetical protein n=1 Tax=Acidovorax sp. TaxID=1872122 RepID=UPI00391DB93A
MNEIEHTKTSIAIQLRAFTDSAKLEFVLAAIAGLGELGGKEAIKHIEELMDIQADRSTPNGDAIWAGLLQAYGRAGRFLPD